MPNNNSALPNSLLDALREADMPPECVLEIISAADSRAPWVLAVDRQAGPGAPYALLYTSGKFEPCDTLGDAYERAGGAEHTPPGDTYELEPLGEDGSPVIGVPPVTVRGQLADIILFEVPRAVAFSTEHVAGVTRAVRQALGNASRARLISGDLQVVVLPEGCRLLKLKEKK